MLGADFMRPIHAIVLLLAGALGGAVIMKAIHPGQPEIPVADAMPPSPAVQAAPPPPIEAQPDKPSPMPPPAEPAAAPVEAEPVKPSPVPPRQIARPSRVRPAPVVEAIARPMPPTHSEPAMAPPPAVEAAPPPVTVEPEPVLPAPVPQPHQVTLNAGMILPVRLVDGLSSERSAPGDAFDATLEQPMMADGLVVAERGARVEGRVIAVERAHVRSAAALALELTALHTSDGHTVAIHTDGNFQHADRGPANNTSKIAGGAILGAAIGALAGGGKGAAIGAGIGGGAGAADVLLVRRPLDLPAETMMTFRLKTSVPLTEVR
jgi:hypothetical protein